MLCWWRSIDIANIHRVADGEVVTSTGDVIDAIYKSTKLDIKFPETYKDQMEYAQGQGLNKRLTLTSFVIWVVLMAY